MKIRVGFVVDIDPEAWELNYGIPADDRTAIREDVRRYVENGALDQMRDLGLLVSS